jgi:hypothetical protein
VRARLRMSMTNRSPAVFLFVYLLPKSTIENAQHDSVRCETGLCLELRVANSPPTKDCTAAMMGYCMAIDHDTRVSMSPQPPQDGRWVIFAPASYKNMTLGEAELF